MKKSVLTLLTFCLITSLAGAQGTLEFSRVLLVSSQQTVPAGTVWKMTNYLPNNAPANTNISISGFGATNYYARLMRVNGTDVFADHVFMQYSSTVQYPASSSLMSGGPIWLPAGTTLSASTGIFAISVIEFNVIP